MADMVFIGWALENGYSPESLSDAATSKEAREAYRNKDRVRKNQRRTVTAVLLTRAGEVAHVFHGCGGPRAAKTAALAWCMVPGHEGDFSDYTLVIDTPVSLSELAKED